MLITWKFPKSIVPHMFETPGLRLTTFVFCVMFMIFTLFNCYLKSIFRLKNRQIEVLQTLLKNASNSIRVRK